jgi:hypothetical protein
MIDQSFEGIFFVTPDFINFYSLKSSGVAHFEYPVNSVLYQELNDSSTLETAFKSFLTVRKFTPGKVIVVLSESLVFHEAITNMNVADQNSVMDNFYKYVPIHKDTMIKHVFIDNNATHILAFDKRLPLLIRDTLEGMSWIIPLIIPMNVFQTGIGDQLTPDLIKVIFKNEPLLIKSRLPLTTEIISATTLQEETTKDKNQQTDKTKVGFLIVALLCLYTVSVYAIMTPFLNNPAKRKVASMSDQRPVVPSNESPTTIAQNPTQIPTAAFKSKELLSVLINAASPIASDTAMIKNALETHGFTGVKTDIGQTDNNADIKILISKNVSPEVQTELYSLLKPSYPNMQVVGAPSEATLDVIIYIR